MEKHQKPKIMETVSLKQLCRLSGSHADWIIELVDYGILQPSGMSVSEWRFDRASIRQAVKARKLQHDLGINLPGVALAFGLMAEKRQLERRLGLVA